MSKTSISASPTGLPSRRLFLAAGPAVAIGASLPSTATAEGSELYRLISERHRISAAYDAICIYDEQPSHPDYSDFRAEMSRLITVEDDLLAKICAFPVKTIEEARAKAEYLTAYMENFGLRDYHVSVLVRSFLI